MVSICTIVKVFAHNTKYRSRVDGGGERPARGKEVARLNGRQFASLGLSRPCLGHASAPRRLALIDGSIPLLLRGCYSFV
jgi:hypothetical protein